MIVMITFEITEDYIVETSDLEKSAQLIKEIWKHKQNSQNDLIKKHKIDYSIDIIENYITE
tara:strand:+ start:162 stop:344 length:183 start_codon:yes stop_codon:yes gene_type:complete